MRPDESQKKRELWIIDYLYGDLSVAEKKIFEAALKSDMQLQKLYDEHCEFDNIMPKGTQPKIDEHRVQGLRWATFRALRTSQTQSLWKIQHLWKKIARVWQVQVSLKSQVFAMTIMFTVGFLLSTTLRLNALKDDSASTLAADSKADSPFSFVGSEDYQVVDVSLHRYDEAKGEVEFSFGLTSQSKVKGNLHNPQIRSLLLKTFTSQSQDQVRLQLTSMLGAYMDAQDVQFSLIYTLLNDPNPGVRYNAVENLVKVAQRPNVRAALLNALAHDVNPGIRIEAFLATSTKIDKALIRVLKNYSLDDANSFIRERSKRILLELDSAIEGGLDGVGAGAGAGVVPRRTAVPESV